MDGSDSMILKKNNEQGFALVEVMVSMMLLSLAVIFSLSVVKTVVQRQIDTKGVLANAWVTKSVKAAFNDYLNGVDATTLASEFPPLETLGCVNKGTNSTGKDRFTTQLCDYQTQINGAQASGTSPKTLTVTIATAVSNNVYYFTGRIRISDTTNPANVMFDRLFVSQK